MEWIERLPVHHPAWLFLSLFGLMAFLAWTRTYFGNIFTQTLQASTNFQVATRMFNDNSVLQKQLDNVLYIIYLLSTGLLLYYLELRFGWSPYGWTGFLLYLFNLSLVTGLFFARILLVNLCGFLFRRMKIFREYLYNMFIFNKLLGIIMLPLLLLSLYSRGILHEISAWLLLGTLVSVILLRVGRGLVFSFKKDISVFYMFLYLCALEIAPLILLYRWLEGIL